MVLRFFSCVAHYSMIVNYGHVRTTPLQGNKIAYCISWGQSVAKVLNTCHKILP